MRSLYALLTAAVFAAAIPSACASAADGRMSGTIPVATPRQAEPQAQAANGAPSAKEIPAAVEPAAGMKDAPEEPAPKARKIAGPVNYVGEIETYKARAEDTLLTIGERHGLGYVEMRSANPSMDPWRPGNGTYVILPKMHLLPDAPRRGIVVNLSEMRLYYYPKDGEIKSYPIGVGREGFSTPVGTTTVVRKTVGPVWRPTDRMRREDPTLKVSYGPGPDNPLGTHALYLGWPQYLLHGTNKPWGIGRRVSSGCVRMYNNAAEELFASVPVGTTVTVVRQPVKFGWIGEMLYIEAHPDGALADQVERIGASQDYKVPPDIFANLSRAAGEARERIDWKAVREALKNRRGYPVPILQGAGEDDYFVTAAMEARAGTSRFGPRLTQEVVAPVTVPEPSAPQQVEAPARRRSNGFNG